MKIGDVLRNVTLACRIMLNAELEELVGYLHMTGSMLLQRKGYCLRISQIIKTSQRS